MLRLPPLWLQAAVPRTVAIRHSHTPYYCHYLGKGPTAYPSSHVSLRSSSTHSTLATLHPRNLYKRTVNYFNNYPFVKYSILLCVTVLGGSLAFESYGKHRKKLQPQILSLPARVGHATLPRPTELHRLRETARATRRRGEGVVYLVGLPGSGKTELVCQYGKQFIEQTHNFTYRFRISKPAVLYLNGTSSHQLCVSLQEAALCLGIRRSGFKEGDGDMVSLARAVQEKLVANKVPWLIIVDNLTPSATPTFQSLFHSSDVDWNWGMGHVVVTSRQVATEGGSVVTLSRSLGEDEALSLLQRLSPSTDFSAVDSNKLSLLLKSSPLDLALAASTVNLYAASLERESSGELLALAEYLDLLGERVSNSSSDITTACVGLYVEAASTQPRVLHTFDLLGALAPAQPVPASVVERHLSHSFYRLPPPEPPALPVNPPQEMSFIAQLKMLLPFGGSKSSPAPSPSAEFDRLHYLRQSPILSFKKYSKEGFELVQVQPMALAELSHQFMEKTIPLLNQAHLREAEEVFDNTAWFRQYRRFDMQKALAQYWSSLPGVDGAGVLTKQDFQTSPVGQRMQYSDYLHTLSHNHRIISSIVSELKLLDDGFASTQYSRYIEPHLAHLSHSDAVSQGDRCMCSYGLASVCSVMTPASAVTVYQTVLEEQRAVLGPHHPAVARTLTDMAGLLFAREDVPGARDLLESTLRIYEAIPAKTRRAEVSVDCGLAKASLAVVVSCQGEKRRSQELLEQALTLYQTVPESGEVSIYQRRLVATTLIDLGHAYLTLGNLVMAQKYVDLAVLALPAIYPDGSEESVRALSVAGTVYALLGDRRESQRVGQEAGKHRAKLDKQQLVFM